uniref:Uncharacterized protein n=1 Tax=Arundo donax TaxID=35708 RepID=A0A0A9BWS5_ARUDO
MRRLSSSSSTHAVPCPPAPPVPCFRLLHRALSAAESKPAAAPALATAWCTGTGADGGSPLPL